MKNSTILVLTALILAGCGGGDGGSSAPDKTPPPPIVDTDNDGIANDVDADDDGDGVLDDEDAFPLDATEWLDTDGDGVGNNADTDDDADGVLDDEDAFPLDVAEWLDTDGDGIGNNADTDDDADGVLDDEDAFPLDGAEWLDTDEDGIGNNTDTDDDNDGFLDDDDAFPLDPTESADTDSDGTGDNSDYFPTDSNCFAQTDGANGICHLTWMANQTISVLEYAKDSGIVYFSGPQWGLVHRYNSQTQHFIEPVNVDFTNTPVMGYSDDHQRFYIADAVGGVSYIDNSELVLFTQCENQIGKIVPTGQFLLLVSEADYGDLGLYDIDAQEFEQQGYWRINASGYTWDPINNRLYHAINGGRGHDLSYIEISQSTGQLVQRYSNGSNFDFVVSLPLTISSDGSKVLTGNGDLYNADDLEWLGRVTGPAAARFGLEDGSFIGVQQGQDNGLLYRHDNQFTIQESLTIEGQILAAFSSGDTGVLVSKTADKVSIELYAANNDSDGDGIINSEDAFAHNAALSQDSDNDGYADEVHEDSEADAETLALLDAFPLDSACWLDEHAVEGECDTNSMVPAFELADSVVVDGVAYLLNPADNTIYRWSTLQQAYLNPIPLNLSWPRLDAHSATQLVYSDAHQRLYVGFDSGAIYSVEIEDLASPVPFLSLTQSIEGLASIGDYILVQDQLGSWESHYIISQDGEITDRKDWSYSSHTYAWNSVTSRVYFLRDGTSPNDLHYETIDQQTGLITESGESPYHSSIGIAHPVRISNDQTKVILGTGRIFDAETLEEVADLQLSAIDIHWLGDYIFALDNESGRASLSVYSDDDYQLLGTIEYNAAGEALLVNGGDLVVATNNGGAPNLINQLAADHDSDGLPGWWEALYGLNDNDNTDASIDLDGDGLTNSQEFNHRTNPIESDSDSDGLSDGDEVNQVGSNPLNADTDGDGLSDGAEINEHGTDPLSQDSDQDGLSDFQELNVVGSDPLNADTDNDGMPDSWEVDNATNPIVNDGAMDDDSDGLLNADEYHYGSHAQVADTDHDTLSDGDEVHTYNTSPTNSDSDDDRMLDGWELDFGLDPLSSADAALDSDEDEFSNFQEYFLKTDPTSALDFPLPQSWFTYQGGASHSGGAPINIDSSNFSVRWSIDLPVTQNHSKPRITVSENKIFVTGQDQANYDNNLLVAYSELDGTSVWQNSYQVGGITAPAYHNGKVYFQTVDYAASYLRAVDENTGDAVFAADYDNQWSELGAATPFLDSLYISGGYNGGIHRFNAQNGEREWYTAGYNNDYWTPAVDEQFVYVFNQGLDLIDRETGQLVATIETEIDSFGSTPVLGLEEDLFVHQGDLIQAFDLKQRSLKWQFDVDNSSAVTVGLGEVYTSYAGAVYALDTRDGSVVWSWEPADSSFIEGEMIATNNLLFVSNGSRTYAIDIASQQQVWSIGSGGRLALSKDNTLYIHSLDSNELTAINISGDSDNDGMPDWYEDFYGFDKAAAEDAALDADNDNLTNLEEFELGSNPVEIDSDADGINDYDEVNVYGSSPILSDTDHDGLPDGWELQHGLDLLVASDGQLDSDGDGTSNFEEYLMQTDPNNSASVPDIISSAHYGFEDQIVPDAWQVNSELGSWFVNDVSASEGNYSLFTDVQSEITLSGLFAGNDFYFSVQTSCSWQPRVTISVAGETTEFAILEESKWQRNSITIPRGVHTLKVTISNDNCTTRLDDFTLQPLQNLLHSGTQFVVQKDDQINFYNYESQFVKSVKIPSNDNGARDIEVMDDGRIAVFNGVFNPNLAIYDPALHQWQQLTHPSWGIVNNVTYGGIDSFGDFVFVTDMGLSSSDQINQGIIKFDLTDNTSTYHDGKEYTDLSIGLDGQLYALANGAVDIYNPVTMELINSLALQDARAVVADSEGYIYLATWEGEILKYNSDGSLVNSLMIGGWLYDMNINQRDEILLTDGNQQLLRTTTGLQSFTIELTQYNASFVATVPTLDQDLDGMPSWWEQRYGFSDLDNSDALADLDADGLINVGEYESLTDPTVSDSDADLLSDGEEVNTYLTNPTTADTDVDGLSDGEEIHTTFTDPLLFDTDNDGYSDGDEVSLYETDPNDANSVPTALTSFSEGFESDPIIVWHHSSGSSMQWSKSGLYSSEGSYSFKSGDINDSQNSSMEFRALVVSGTLSFDALVLSESCCDRLRVYVDDELRMDTTSQQWGNYSIELDNGDRKVRFEYSKDGSVSYLEDAVWIDNLIFNSH